MTKGQRRRTWLARAALAAVVLAAHATPVGAADSVLLLGNSFSRRVHQELVRLVRSALRDTVVQRKGGNGWTLEMHSTSRATLSRLRSSPWTAVVLQEQSDGLDEERYPFARTLDAEIAAAGARTVFFLTWADRDEELDVYDRLLGEPGGNAGCVPIAQELNAAIAPVGWAFRAAILEDPLADLWAGDGHHPSRRGQYMAALVLYATIFRESPVGLAPARKLTPEQALHDQLLVEDVVFGDRERWNLDAP